MAIRFPQPAGAFLVGRWAMGRNSAGRAGSARPMIVAGLCLGAPLVAGILGLASIGAAELATGMRAPRDWNELSDAFSVVNGVFSVFALVVVGATLWVQFNELRMQRAELRMQREAAEQSQRELHRSSEADVRALHVHLAEMAIGDSDLAAVWSRFDPDIPPRRLKQLFFANLVLGHYNLVYRLGDRDERYVRSVLTDQFQNPLMREFWATVREFRRAARPPGTPEGDFDSLCEAAYQETRRDWET
ncbi:DUF6082 family protein [Dactylosporangium sp. CA-139066]|uniref:DUF6082 family protein n=1 Tax=Dactylosporangium sp. CA-139066 TaxID=3239930 RepID=UPI003D8CAF6C